ncbi:MAG: hypothetical protein ABSE05_16720 [Syntrophales bacterium]|jgi:ribosomal protein S27AE
MTRQECRSITIHLIETGEIKKKDFCEKCGSGKFVECHHNDYTNPKDINWFCKSCHKFLHGELKRNGESIPMDKPDTGSVLNIKGIDDNLMMELKIMAARKRVTMRELVIEGIHLVIARNDKGK